VEASWARVSQFGLKTGGGVTAGGAHHHGGCVKDKLNTDGSMRWAASDSATLALSVSLY
jgi:hypothetical protein